MNKIEFCEYVDACGNKLDYAETNKAFSTLSESEQREFLDALNESVKERLQGTGCELINLDNTHIAFSIRLIKEGILRKRGPNRRIKGKPNKCYENCLDLVDNKHVIYAGLALNKGLAEDHLGNRYPLLIWTPHSWLVNKRTKHILETTPAESAEWLMYFGVQVTPEELLYMITQNLPRDTPHATSMEEFERQYKIEQMS